MLKYIIFDFDGTLVDSKDFSIQVINQLAEKYQFQNLSREQIEELRKYSIADRCRMMNFPLHKIPFAFIEFLLLYKEGTQQLRLFPGIKELLAKLEEDNYKLAVISSNTEENIKQSLQNNQVDNISEILAASIFGKDKIIKKFLKNHRLKASEVLYVGDELRDILACKQAGVKIAWVDWGFDSIEVTKVEQPDFFAHQPLDIYSITQSIGG
ncbi:MAG: HAD-IA family hydrolase [Anaerobacillus sp.]|uniref:HAD-IA family hydrolase n=1 Tax=Anaerobacillus sp. TaxID=1872506 RepID=UPI0039193A58